MTGVGRSSINCSVIHIATNARLVKSCLKLAVLLYSVPVCGVPSVKQKKLYVRATSPMRIIFGNPLSYVGGRNIGLVNLRRKSSATGALILPSVIINIRSRVIRTFWLSTYAQGD